MSNAETNPLAVVSIVCGMLGLFGILPAIGSVIAVVTGHLARRELASQQHAQQGAELAMVGLVSGYLGLVMVCMGILVTVAIFGTGALVAVLVVIAGLFGVAL